MSKLSDDFNEYPSSGLIGLAFGTIAQSQKPTFFERLIQDKKVAAPLFSVHLTRNQETGSEVCFGCIDPNKAKGTIIWVPVKSKVCHSTALPVSAMDLLSGVLVCDDGWAIPQLNSQSADRPCCCTFLLSAFHGSRGVS